jgi:acyl-CoA synthetase (AMP-forming)/AMP-acid ligase II
MSTVRTLPEALADAARTGAGYCFVSGAEETWRSYAEIRRSALGVARALIDAGLRRGDLVAIILADPEQFVTTLFGASIAGVVPASMYAPAAAHDQSRELQLVAAILGGSHARAVVTTRALAPAIADIRDACPSLELVLCREDLDAPPGEPPALPAPGDIAFVQFTSGSTSSPKGVTLTHANVSANVDAFRGPSGVASGPGDVAVSWLPLNHDMGLVGMALGAVYATRPCVLLPPQAFVKRPAEWLRAITRHRGTISFAPNFAYDLCVRRVQDVSGLDLSSWRIAGCGAEPVHPATLAAFAEKFASVGFRDTSFLPCYGLAEHVLAATFPPRGRRPRTETLAADDLTARRVATPHRGDGPSVSLVSCGSALPGHDIRIVGEDGRPLPERRVGEIALAGPSVMLSYYKQEALTAETVRDGWLYTGDLGYLSGGELFVCGRTKDLIIVNGRKYHPQDLEWAVEGLPGVRRGRIVAFASAEHGRADRVVIVAERSGTVTPDALAGAIRHRISDLFGLYVDEVAIVPSGTVGRTTSGKVQRAATKTRYERGELTPAPIRA